MSTRGSAPRWLGLGVLGGLGLGGADQAYATLLEALARTRYESQARERELDASARAEEADVLRDEQRIEREGVAEARGDLEAFRAALDDVRARSGGENSREVPYDARNPTQNDLADLLIQYVVRPGYAEVRTEEVVGGGYTYWISVRWPELRSLAESLGQPLPES